MANTNSLFDTYDNNLSIPDSKREKMSESRESTRERIKNWFSKHHPDYPVSFWIQGSHKNHLNIRTEDEDCDQDDGIYIDRDPADSVDGTTLQEWILEALKGSTSTPPKHKKKCLRNYYRPDYLGPFHIDYPSYYKTDDMPHPLLTVKNGNLEESDPQEFTEWLNGHVDEKGQLRRLIRYLKGWADFKKKWCEMPNGLTLTVLVCNHFTGRDGRDDKALYYTLCGIYNDLDSRWECIMPSTPHDDLLSRYDESFRISFMHALWDLIQDAKRALDEESRYEASKLWQNHLGPKYPLAPKEPGKGSREALGALVGDNKPYFDGGKSIF
ncbi:cyclic GMP-AMP synthase DncV-like nucleotidyltransferase [Membranihabitans maritimus]|uniref:cyclic GMP-AMP synthase DncV-like nucleotidyltransferase n=1 Tax=Membranihabitans maritimus TaxID=2904244 RepID=UPI001F1E6DB9|nr:hypothetical protein [Membranihabitans maritimus]